MEAEIPPSKAGEWWIPGKECRKILGSLTIDQTGRAYVDFDRGFLGGDEGICFQDNISIVNGRLSGGEYVTLIDSFYISSSEESKPSKICSNFVLVGVRKERKEDISFSRVEFSLNGLREWLGTDVFPAGRNASHDIDVFGIRCLELGIQAKFPQRIFPTKDQSRFGFFKLSLESQFDMNDCIEKAHLIRKFVSIGLGVPTPIHSMRLYDNTDDSESVELYYSDIYRRPIKQSVYRKNMIFCYGEVLDIFNSILEKCVVGQKGHGSFHDLFLLSLNLKGMDNVSFPGKIESRFCSAFRLWSRFTKLDFQASMAVM